MNDIILGDCLEEMKNIPDNSIDMALIDLPYFKVVNNKWDNIWNSKEEYLSWVKTLITETSFLLKPDSNIFVFTGRQYNRHIALIMDEIFNENRIIIWSRKRGFNTSRGKALSSGYEPICFYSKGDNTFNMIKIKSNSIRPEYNTGTLKDGINLSDVWSDINALPHNSKEKTSHPTQKPLKLIERIIQLGSNEGDMVLDCCAGSGTTGVACKNLNRNYILIEKEEKYYDIIKERLNA